MKHGYSILLGETLEAAQLDYHDCEQYQVVCPACREPTFKGVREAGRDSPTHYLSHYGVSAGTGEECELRITSAATAKLDQDNKKAREQRLAYFLSVLQRTVKLSPLYQNPDKAHRTLQASGGLRVLRELSWPSFLEDPKTMFDEGAQDFRRHLSSVAWKLSTTVSADRQHRIARDMWLTLLTPASRGNFDFLFNHAFLTVQAGFQNTQLRGDVSQANALLIRAMTDIIECREKYANNLLGSMSNTFMPEGYNRLEDGTEDPERSPLLVRIYGQTAQEMVGALLSFPYAELLKQKYGDPRRCTRNGRGSANSSGACREATRKASLRRLTSLKDGDSHSWKARPGLGHNGRQRPLMPQFLIHCAGQLRLSLRHRSRKFFPQPDQPAFLAQESSSYLQVPGLGIRELSSGPDARERASDTGAESSVKVILRAQLL